MKPSKSRFVSMESISLSDLFKGKPGAMGLYLPRQDDEGKMRVNISRISAHAKSLGVRYKKKCEIKTLLVLEQDQDQELPTPFKMVQVVIKDDTDLTPQGKRYTEANARNTSETSQ